jgi:hypothetical protein
MNLCGIAFLALLFAAPPQQSAKPGEVGQQHQQPQPNAEKAGNVVTPNEQLTKNPEPDPHRKEQSGKGDPDPWRHGDTINTITAVATALYFAATVSILVLMRDANKKAEKAYEDSARDTAESLRLTRESNAAAISQAQTIKRVLRAWLATGDVARIPDINALPDKVLVPLLNTGHSPAQNVRIHIVMAFLNTLQFPSEPEFPPFVEEDGAVRSTTIIPSGESKTVVAEMPSLDDSQLHAITDRKGALFLYGRVEYADIFGDQHLTTFAMWNDVRSGRWISCARHNEQT